MKKKALLAMLLTMTLLLSGCALIKKDAAVDAARVILSYDGKEYTKAEVLSEVNYQLQYNAYLNSMYGMSYDTTDAANIAQAQENAVAAMTKDLVLRAKMKEMKLEDQLTEEDLASIKETAQKNYDSGVEPTKSLVEDETLEGDALTEAAKEMMTKQGVTLETYEDSAKENKLLEMLRADIIKDVTVTDEEIQADFDSKVESAKTTYGEDAAAYADAANSSTIYYAPAGVRRVKQILIKFTDEDQTAITDAKSAVTTANSKVTAAQQVLDTEGITDEEKTQAEADLKAAQEELDAANKKVEELTDKAYTDIDEAADDVLKQLADGADWDTLMAEKTQDPGMQGDRDTAKTGYAVAEGMTSFDSAFVTAAMGLKAIGDVSDKTRGSSNGYYIIKYVADQAEGPIALDQVKETLQSSLLTTAQNNKYNETVEQWIKDANIKADMNALKD